LLGKARIKGIRGKRGENTEKERGRKERANPYETGR
jgi:hypothetical protein